MNVIFCACESLTDVTGHSALSKPKPRASAGDGVAASRQLAGDLSHSELGSAVGNAPRAPPGLPVSPARAGQGCPGTSGEPPITGRD